ncbi:hypothetical protein LSAT2_023085 [Lamellibrachia satsuma]|nr:hypothetical protein LSAT2_023085 [Lamellibrachia satsuma]
MPQYRVCYGVSRRRAFTTVATTPYLGGTPSLPTRHTLQYKRKKFTRDRRVLAMTLSVFRRCSDPSTRSNESVQAAIRARLVLVWRVVDFQMSVSLLKARAVIAILVESSFPMLLSVEIKLPRVGAPFPNTHCCSKAVRVLRQSGHVART